MSIDIDITVTGVNGANEFCILHLYLHFAQSASAELQLFHQLHHLAPDKVGLVAEIDVVEQVVGLLQDDVLQVVVAVDEPSLAGIEPAIEQAVVVIEVVDIVVDGE